MRDYAKNVLAVQLTGKENPINNAGCMIVAGGPVLVIYLKRRVYLYRPDRHRRNYRRHL